MYGRTDLDRYKHGCKSLENMYIKPQGPVVRRPGTEFIIDLQSICTETIDSYRLIDFVFDETQSYCIIVTTQQTLVEIFFGSYDASGSINGLVEDPASPGNPYKVNHTLATYNVQADEIDWVQSKDVLYIASPSHQPLKLTRLAHDNWTLANVTFAATTIPTEWGTSSPVVFTDPPHKVSFYDRRLVYGGNTAEPQTLWFSCVGQGNYDDFTVTGGGVVATDSLTFTMASEKHNKIQWMTAGKKLVVGTMGNEWTVSGQGGNAIAYNSIAVERHSARGGQALKPIHVGSSILFLERLGRAINEFIYDYQIDGYQSNDLSVLAPHLTDQHAITRWAYQQTPNSIVWAIRDDGTILGFTFQRQHQIMGWTRHITEGRFRDVCCIPNQNYRETDVWFAIERDIAGIGDNRIYIEVLRNEFMSDDPEDAWFVDSALAYDNPSTPIQTVTGLGHLEGETVSILANGAVHPDRVVSSGQISLDYEATKIVVGLRYDSQLIPLPLELNLRDGTSIGRFQRITNMSVFLYRSMGMWIGKEEDEMEEVPFRLPTHPTGTAVPLFTGIRKVGFPEGYDFDTTIIVEQRQPLPMTVLAIMDESGVYT